MDSEVGDPLPGGLRAFITFAEEVVTWRMVNLVGRQSDELPIYQDYRTFHFDRAHYERQIAALPSAPVYDWNSERPINKLWWAAASGE